jgi:hypothetical protein
MSAVDNTMRVVPGSASSAGCPPGHPMHLHEIQAGRRGNPSLIAGLEYALKNEYGDVPERVRVRVEELYAKAELVCSETWLRATYFHFNNCYSPDGVERRVERLLIPGRGEPYYPGHPKVESGEVVLSRYRSLNKGPVVQADDPRCVPEHHAGYLAVRRYFPDHQPRLDLIADPQYPGGTCAKCGERVQYEARFDALAKVIPGHPRWAYVVDCPKGGRHEVVKP